MNFACNTQSKFSYGFSGDQLFARVVIDNNELDSLQFKISLLTAKLKDFTTSKKFTSLFVPERFAHMIIIHLPRRSI